MRQQLPAYLLFLLAMCCCITTLGQSYQSLRTYQSKREASYYSRHQAHVQPYSWYMVQPGFAFTSVAVSAESGSTFERAYLTIAQDTFFLREDEHQLPEDTARQSQLVIPGAILGTFGFYSGSLEGEVTFSLMNASMGRSDTPSSRLEKQKQYQDQPCAQPPVIPQSEWRSGLPPPSYQRVETNVQHIIVHHSAGSNTNADYTNTVRNIYLFHTIDRGWSDIGYNFLIGQDGTIFQGRSFGDASLETDDIRGAHFCGRNSGTMGICMLGNFNTAVPSDISISSLVQLAAWKLHKESLDPFDVFSHPANANLRALAAHRNGCPTECPGDNLYARLGDIRTQIAVRLEGECGEEEEPKPVAFNVYPVPAKEVVNISLPADNTPEAFWLTDALGQQFEAPAYWAEDVWAIQTSGLATGLYVLQVSGANFAYKRKLLIY